MFTVCQVCPGSVTELCEGSLTPGEGGENIKTVSHAACQHNQGMASTLILCVTTSSKISNVYYKYFNSGLLGKFCYNRSIFDLVSEGHAAPHCSKLSEFEIQSLLSNLSPIERPPQSEEGLSGCQPSVSQTCQINSEANIKVRCDMDYLWRLIPVGT